MRSLSIAALVSAAALASCSKNSELIGSYIDTDYSDGVMMVQIDTVDQRNVHGTVTLATFGPNGVINSKRAPLSGTIEGKALNLTVENGTGANILNGTVVPSGLDLTGMGDGQLVRFLFKREDAAEFNKAVASLRVKSAQSQQEVQTAAFRAQNAARGLQIQSQIDGQVDQLLSEAEAITAKSKQFDNAVAYYQHISARNSQLRAIAARIEADDPNAQRADAESRIDGNRNLAANAHEQMQAFWQNVEAQSEANLRRTSDFMVDCQSQKQLSCTRLANAVAEYNRSMSELRGVAGREAAAYDTQRTRF